MLRRLVGATIALSAILGGITVAADMSSSYTPVCITMQAGQGWNWVAAQFAPGITGTARTQFIARLQALNEEGTLTTGEMVCADPNDPALQPTTTTSPTTTTAPTTSTAPSTSTTSTPSTSTTVPATGSSVAVVPLGQALPSEATCASRVQPMTENRPDNADENATRGNSPNDENPRVTGNFVGTTDEIIQWAACKWGMDVDWARAQAAIESWWLMSTIGDNGESFGILQVRRPYHGTAFENENAVLSTAYNADYAWSIWRRCFEGEYTWLNQFERGRDYAAGDGTGCLGLWFSGRWYTVDAVGYIGRVTDYHDDRIWRDVSFPPAQPRGTPPSTTTSSVTATAPTTTVAASSTSTTTTSLTTTTAVASSTTSTTSSIPPTTVPPPPSQSGVWQQIAPAAVSTEPNNNSNFGFQSIAAAPDGTLFVTADYQGLYRSTDNGATWTKWSTDGDLETGTPWTLQVDPFNPQTMWANAGYGVGGPLRSTDGGRTWTRMTVGSPTQNNDVYSIALDPNQQGHMLVAWHSAWTTGSSGISESFDGGTTWTHRQPGSSNWGTGHAVFFLGNSSTWLVGTQNDGIWRTTNSGVSWTQVSSVSITHGATGALTRVGSALFLAHGRQVSRSTDNGVTWTNISSGLPAFAEFSTVASDGVNLYTAPSFPVLPTYAEANRSWYTRPVAGGTWQPMTSSPNPCYRTRCNGPRQTVFAGGFVFTANYSGGVWRLSAFTSPPLPTTTSTSTVPNLTTTTSSSVATSSTSSLPPSTTSTSPPTPTVTSTLPPGTSSTTTTLPPQPSSGFLEDFNGDPTALDRFRFGVLHRDTFGSQGSNQPTWPADHQLVGGGDCTTPDLTHTVHQNNEADALYVCSSVAGDPAKGHLMTTMGDVTGYSFVYFSPDRTFTTETVVSWDQNVTNVGLRQWTEVSIVPADAADVYCADDPNGLDLPCEFPGFTDDLGHVIDGGYPTAAVVFGSGPLGGDLTYTVNGRTVSGSMGNVCALDPAGCGSVAIRRTFSITENSNGTITFRFWNSEVTVPGRFPAGEWKVVFSQHVYTPRKTDTLPPGQTTPVTFTVHWDQIVVR